ncbi:hypothetical protein OPT61_g2245 [Boeremia exigua]|uniref:Uncharacterized protein n=1 Tax=Boeremia exigua TaxID=749465 RepID=A0ACC2IME7_9PLEO|nr:hypothetical protein OPT61_g2245 [Boeremia exigua]
MKTQQVAMLLCLASGGLSMPFVGGDIIARDPQGNGYSKAKIADVVARDPQGNGYSKAKIADVVARDT